MNENISINIDDKSVDSDAFIKAVTSFFKVARSVSDEAARSANNVSWNVTVKAGSNIVTGHPMLLNSDPQLKNTIVLSLYSGIASIAKGILERPRFFNDVALDAVRAMANSGCENLKVQSNGEAVRLWKTAVSTVDIILGTPHKSFGDVEGKLFLLRDQSGFKFSIVEPIHGYEVTCYITDNNLIEKAMLGFRKRVCANGLVKYRRDGTPISVDVDDLVVFDDDSKLPKTTDIVGIYKNQ